MRFHVSILVLCALAFGCQKARDKNKDKGADPTTVTPGSGSGRPTGPGSGSNAVVMPPTPPPGPPAKDIDSKEILARPEGAAKSVHVKHVLLAWKDLAQLYARRGGMDPRAANRSNEEAAKLAQDLVAQLKAKPEMIDELVKQHSEDPGSKTGEPYEVKADTSFVPEFKNLALRLKEKEAGIVKTMFGYHVMMRVAPPPPDPLESHDILRREPEQSAVHMQHIAVGWKDSVANKDPRAQKRTKAEADKLAKEILDKVRAKGDMKKLMKEFSEDPNSKDTGNVYDVPPESPDNPVKSLAMRLKIDEAGLVKTPFGWHVVKRVPPPPPPPPDSLDSVEILKRKPETKKSKVKHILLGWADVNGGDERGKKRTRPELEKLVKETVAKLQKGEKIEKLMADLSEDKGSATSGMEYEATPEAGLVEPFKNLALRLKVKEVGVVKTQFGIHIIQRME